MSEDKNITLLRGKVTHIEKLLKKVDREELRQWREETLMILDFLITQDSKYYSNFSNISYRSNVISMVNEERNRINDGEAYKSGLEEAKSSLNAIIFGIDRGLLS